MSWKVVLKKSMKSEGGAMDIKPNVAELDQDIESSKRKLGDSRSRTCPVCSKKLRTHKALLEHHSKMHISNKGFCCPVCNAQFSWEENLKLHMTVHEENHSICTICGRSFNDQKSLRLHMFKHRAEVNPEANNAKPYACTLCHQRFKFDFSLDAHIKQHANQLVNDQDEGEKAKKKRRVQTKAATTSHSSTTVQIKLEPDTDESPEVLDNTPTGEPVVRDTRPVVLNLRSSQLSNMRGASISYDIVGPSRMKQRSLPTNNDGERPYICPICDVRFKFDFSLEAHIKAHTMEGLLNTESSNEQPSEQQVPSKVIVVKPMKPRQLGSITKREGQADSGMLECAICKQMLHGAKALGEHHIQTHMSNKLFQCNYCSAKFSWVQNLHKHLTTHTAGKNPTCLQCGKCFGSMKSLEEHAQSHRTEIRESRPFKCLHCRTSFKYEFTLEAHMMTHNTRDDTADGDDAEQEKTRVTRSTRRNAENKTDVKGNVRANKARTSCCVPQCSIPGYVIEGNETVTFHNFPLNDKKRLKKWLTKIRREPGPNFNLTKHTKICSRHFLSSDFLVNKKKRLTSTAVPSTFPWSRKKRN